MNRELGGFSRLCGVLFFGAALCSSCYISKYGCPKVDKNLWMKVHFCIFHMLLESPSYWLWLESYESHNSMHLCCLKPGTVSVVHCFRLPYLQNLEKCSTRTFQRISSAFQRYELLLHRIKRSRLMEDLVHCYFSAHKEFQTPCSYSCT